MPNDTVVSIPSDTEYKPEVNYEMQDIGFALYETIGFRPTQEDTAFRCSFPNDRFSLLKLEPVDIGHRLWTSYQLLDKDFMEGHKDKISGTTASTTVYDGKDSLITATLADAVVFVVVYDCGGEVLGVKRLNSVTHKPIIKSESDRIVAAGGSVYYGRVKGKLNLSRAIGDKDLKQFGVCADATIDISTLREIYTSLDIEPARVGKTQIITTCDGFTDGAQARIELEINGQDKALHEQYLLNILNKMPKEDRKSELKIADTLAGTAIMDNSKDNISVAVQSLIFNSPCLIGVYDGHAGAEASIFVATNIGRVFDEQCDLKNEAYAEQPLSVHQKPDIYARDNNDEAVLARLNAQASEPRDRSIEHPVAAAAAANLRAEEAVTQLGDDTLAGGASGGITGASLQLQGIRFFDNKQPSGHANALDFLSGDVAEALTPLGKH